MADRHPPPTAALFFGVVFAAAFTASHLHPLNLPVWTAAITALLTLLGYAIARDVAGRQRHALVIAVSLFAVHTAVIVESHRDVDDHPLVDWLDENRRSAEIEGEITAGPIFFDGGVSFDLRLTSVDIGDGRLTDGEPKLRVFYRTHRLAACSRLPLPGDRISVWATLQRFSPQHVPWRLSQRRLMQARGYAATAAVDEPIEFLEPPPPGLLDRLQRTLASHRVDLERRLADHVDGPARAIATAMITGSRGELSPETREPFDVTSTGHILAISGLHFAVIAALIAFAVRLLTDRWPRLYRRWPRRMLVGVITLVLLAVYLMAIGAPVSARRAFGMTGIAVAVVCFTPWRLPPLSALAAVAGILLLIRPSLVVEVGFQLSVCATGGILLFLRFRPPLLRPPDIPGPTEESSTRRRLRRLGTFVGISVSATLATWPILVRMTGELPVAGLWTNLVVVPLVGSVLFPMLVAGTMALFVFEPAASLLLTVAGEGLMLLRSGLDAIAYAPGSVIRWGTPSNLEVVGLFVSVGLCIAGGFHRRAVLLAASITVMAATPGWVAEWTGPDVTRVHFIDVGQGDAILIELSDDTTVLIDAGGRPVGADPGLQRVVPYLRHRGIRRLDVAMLTHDHYDHYGGLFAVVRPFRPRSFVVADDDDQSDDVRQLIEKMRDHGALIVEPTRRETELETDTPLTIRRSPAAGTGHNDRSLVADFTYADARVVLPGDLETLGEHWLIDELHGPAAVLKAPHHGSNTSSTPEFLEHFAPAVAVASAGRHNRFGHPDPEVVDRYDAYSIDLFRTDRQGSIVTTIDADGTVTVETAR